MARLPLMNAVAIPAAGTYTSTPVAIVDASDLLIQFAFDYGSGGTSVKAYLQTSLDAGVTWADIASFAPANADSTRLVSVSSGGALSTLTAPTDAALADNTAVDGIIGDLLRVKYVVVGVYVASTLSVFAEAKAGVGGSGSVALVGTSAVTLADGADVAQGTTTDASTANTVIGRLKKLISLIPAAPGATTPANSLATVEAYAATGTLTNVASSASSVTLLAANTSRRGATVYNDSTATLYLKLGATASATSFTVQLGAGDYYEVPARYSGIIDGIWASATGSARITELS